MSCCPCDHSPLSQSPASCEANQDLAEAVLQHDAQRALEHPRAQVARAVEAVVDVDQVVLLGHGRPWSRALSLRLYSAAIPSSGPFCVCSLTS